MRSRFNRVVFRQWILATLAMLVGVVFLCSQIDAAMSKRTDEGDKDKILAKPAAVLPNVQERVHRVGEVRMGMTNWGMVGSQGRDLRESRSGCFMPNPDEEAIAPSFEYPAGSDLEHLYAGGIWVGAVIKDTAYVSVGMDGWFGVNELWPDGPAPLGEILELSTCDGSECYLTDAVSEQDIIAVFTDTSADIPLSPQQDPWDNRKHRPLNIKVTRESHSWSGEGYNDFIIAEYTIENIGPNTLSNVYLGFYMDADIMHIDENPYGSYGAQDDITGFLIRSVPPGDILRIAWAADNDGHGDKDGGKDATVFTDKSPTSVMGMTVLDFPNPAMNYSYNWWISHGSGAPYDWGPWKAASQAKWAAMNPYGSGNNFPNNVLGTPGGDVSKYFIMSNQEFDYDQIYSCIWPSQFPEEGWLPVNETMCGNLANGFDIRFLLSFGPFEYLYPNDSLHFAVAHIIGENFHVDPQNLAVDPNMSDPDRYYSNLDFSDLVENALKAKMVYDSGYVVATPPMPADVEIYKCDDTTRLFLNWTKVTHGDVNGYNVYRSTQSGVYNDPPIFISQPITDSVAFVDSNLAPSHRYYYVVTSVNSYGESGPSPEVSAIPGAVDGVPYDLKAFDVGDGSTLRLQWTMLPEDMVHGFTVHYGTSSEHYTQKVDVGYVFEYDLSGLTEGTTYYLAVCGHTQYHVEGDLSEEVSAVPQLTPSKPSNLMAQAGTGMVKLLWYPNQELDLAGYKVYRSDMDTLNFQFLATVSAPNVTYEDNSVTDSMDYYYAVTAVDTDSNESEKAISSKVTPNPSSIGYMSSSLYDGVFGWGNYDGVPNPGEAVWIYLRATNTGSTWILDPKAVVHADDSYIMQAYKETDTLYCEYDIAPGTSGLFQRVVKEYPEARYWRRYVLTISSDCPSGYEFRLPVDFYDGQGNFLGEDTINFTVSGSDITPPRAIDVNCRPQMATSKIDTIFALIEEGADIKEAYGEIYSSDNDSLVKSVALNDSGTNGDLLANDRIFSGIYQDTSSGEFYVSINATDFYDNSYISRKIAGFSTAPLDVTAKILFYYCHVHDPYSLWALHNPTGGTLLLIPYSKDEYLKTLDSLSEYYAVWDEFLRGEIPDTILNSFAHKNVVFVDDGGALSENTQNNLISLLNTGGRPFISSRWMGSSLWETEFYRDYLHGNYVGSSWSEGVVGIPGDSITTGLYFPFSVPSFYQEEIDPISPATTTLKYYGETYTPSSSGSAAIKVDNGLYKLVYAAFGLDDLPDSSRYVLLNKILDWLGAPSDKVPQLSISIFQNSVLTKYIDLYVSSTVELAEPPVTQMTVGSAAPDTITLSELAPQTYQGNYIFTASGTCSLFVSALSARGITKDTVRLFDVQLMESQSGGKLISYDGRLQLMVPYGAVAESTYFTCIPLSGENSSSLPQAEFLGIPYQLSPVERGFGNALTIVFPLDDYNLAEEEKSRICVYKQEKDKWIIVDSNLDVEQNCVSAKVKELGVYRLGFGQSEPQASIPERYELFQNYPNPFNPNTVIKYNLRHAGNVKLTIYNILGQKVKTLVNQHQDAGHKSIIWNGEDEKQKEVASGIYFYRIEVEDEYSAVKKMVLVK